jgi:hypothetical protein
MNPKATRGIDAGCRGGSLCPPRGRREEKRLNHGGTEGTEEKMKAEEKKRKGNHKDTKKRRKI